MFYFRAAERFSNGEWAWERPIKKTQLFEVEILPTWRRFPWNKKPKSWFVSRIKPTFMWSLKLSRFLDLMSNSLSFHSDWFSPERKNSPFSGSLSSAIIVWEESTICWKKDICENFNLKSVSDANQDLF